MKKLICIVAGALVGALALPVHQGRGGPPLAGNDTDKDGICDLTSQPVAQHSFLGARRIGASLASTNTEKEGTPNATSQPVVPNTFWGRGAWGRGGAWGDRGVWFTAQPNTNKAVATVRALDVTGTWRTQFPGRQDNSREFVFQLKQAPDGSLSGTVAGFRSENEITEGKVEENHIRFSAENMYHARNVVMTFHGTVEADEMKLTVEFADNTPSLEVIARKDPSRGR